MSTTNRSVWRDLEPDEVTLHVRRCSFCGKFKKKLKAHWFFTGLYCFNCILEVLYNDTRSFKEMRK